MLTRAYQYEELLNIATNGDWKSAQRVYHIILDFNGVEYETNETDHYFFLMQDDIFTEFKNALDDEREIYWNITKDLPEYEEETFIDTLINKLNDIFESCK